MNIPASPDSIILAGSDLNSAVRPRTDGGVCFGILTFLKDSGGPSVIMKMEEANIGGLGVGVTVDIQRTDGKYRKMDILYDFVLSVSVILVTGCQNEGTGRDRVHLTLFCS